MCLWQPPQLAKGVVTDTDVLSHVGDVMEKCRANGAVRVPSEDKVKTLLNEANDLVESNLSPEEVGFFAIHRCFDAAATAHAHLFGL